MAHIVSATQPPSGALGDEWFNPTTNKFYKLVAVGGTSVQWLDYTPVVINAGNNIIISANNTITANVSGGGGGVVTGAATNAESTFTAKQIFQGNNIATALKLINAVEQVYLSGISLGSSGNTTVNIDLANSSVYYFNTSSSNNWNINFRLSSTMSLNNALATNESISAVVMATQGATPYYANSLLIDGVTVTPRWQDALSPTGGNASSIDIYNYTIIKTANGTYTVLGSQTRFA
jgi:hypothetical protein